MSGEYSNPSQQSTIILRPPAAGGKVADLMRDVLADEDVEEARPADESVTIVYHRRGGFFRARNDEQPGDRILGFELLEKTAEDWLGSTWRAERIGPPAVKAALSIIKLPADTQEAAMRFAEDRRLLKNLSHPNIAAVLDAGGTARGDFCLATELIRGQAITVHCDEKRLGIRERLELFIPACLAVHQAHAIGLLHRDLRPANILVTESGGRAMPMVAGFGIAHAIARDDEKWLDLRLRAAERRPRDVFPWLSPEQAASRPASAACDVWGLGAILRQLIAGEPPLFRGLLKMRSHQVLKLIRETAAPKPSALLAAKPQAEQEHIAAVRGMRACDLIAQLREGLDAIVLRATDLDPARRYATAGELAEDLNRRLRGEPVSAAAAKKPGILGRWLRS